MAIPLGCRALRTLTSNLWAGRSTTLNFWSWFNTFAGGTAFPAVGAGGYASLGTNNTVDEPHHNFGYSVGIINTRGAHTLKYGFQGNVRDTNQRKSSGTGGSYSFTGQFTQGPNPFLPAANTGNGLADMLLGFPGGGGMASGFTHSHEEQVFGLVFAGRLACDASPDPQPRSPLRV